MPFTTNFVVLVVYVMCLPVNQSFGAIENVCPVICECPQPKQSDFITKMKCVNRSLTETDLRNRALLMIPHHLQHLNLAKNRITRLPNSFLSLPGLTKLILSENKIRIIEEGAFNNLTQLEILDLSYNDIQIITKLTLSPLLMLERLKIQKNKLTTLEYNIFSNLKSLSAIDMSENPWQCDCNLIWLSDWARNTTVKLTPPPKCESPLDFSGIPLKRLLLECTDPELSPSNNQVVFAGDPLSLRCRSGGGSERVRWAWGDADPKDRFAEVNVTELTLPEHGWVESWLYIKNLVPEHSGDWICQQVAGRNRSALVSVLVLSSNTRYCRDNKTSNNKGIYFWPSTVVGHSVQLPCAIERIGAPESHAVHSCSIEGNWEKLNTSMCPYISETTKMLEQFSLENLTASSDNSLLTKAKLLRNLTEPVDVMIDPMDVVFVSRTVIMYAPYVSYDRDLGSVLVDVIAGLLRLQRSVLHQAEKIDKALSKMVSVLENVAREVPSFQYHGVLLALEEFDVDRDRFSRMTCVWRRIVPKGTQQFHCATNVQPIMDVSGHEIEASVELPSSIFDNLDSSSRKLIVTMFANGHFFPDARKLLGHISSCVVGANIAGADVGNLTEPVVVMTQLVSGKTPDPVWWDADLHDGSGGWSSEACRSSHFSGNLVVFHCDRLGYYALLQPENLKSRGFNTAFGHAALYSGSFVILACLAVAVVTYIVSHGTVQMSRRAKHAAVNTWISLSLLCFLFSFGVFATEKARTCEVVGLALHYFSMSVLLWMTVAANHMYKRLSRGSVDRASVEIPGGVPVHKPILGLYLVGWGIGLIICGISGAVHLRDYANPSFCFLDAGPALSAVLVPTAILVTVLCILYFLSLCAIRNNDVNGQLSEGTQGTENVDLELLEDGAAACTDRQSARSVVTDSEDIEDAEHSPMIQLKAQVIVLILFVMLWSSAALTVTSVVHTMVPHQEAVGSSLYCLISFCMGAFILYFYCVARSDVRARWGAWRRRRCCRSRSISDTRASLPLQSAPPTLLSNGPPSINSGVTGRSSSSHRTKAVTELNNSERGDSSSGKPTNNVNLVALHRQLYRSNNSMPTYHEVASQDWADAFYNPRQSIVAKKFFKKQRRNRRNELGLRRRGDGGGTSEGEVSHACRTWRPSAESAVFLSSDMENNSEKMGPSLFAYGSKINNTNIHIGQSARRRDSQSPKDPNVHSEGEGEKNSGKILLSRLVIGAEGEAPGPSTQLARLDEEPIAPDCRSIELQCSLGDSSDVPDGDDSFSQKIDSLRLQSDQSCTDSPVSPPQYVTVLDPKYGVVKVTMNDYYLQSHRLSLASSAGEPVQDFQRSSLPSTPEELEDRDNDGQKEELCSPSREPEERLNISPVCRRECEELLKLDEKPLTIEMDPASSNVAHPPKNYDLISMPRNYVFHKKPTKRRSLPSSPEGRGRDPRLSLPSSPEAREGNTPHYPFRQSPRLTIPPPPVEEFNSVCSSEHLDSENCEQWEKPPSPDPVVRRLDPRQPNERRRPQSETKSDKVSINEDSLNVDEPKRETSV